MQKTCFPLICCKCSMLSKYWVNYSFHSRKNQFDYWYNFLSKNLPTKNCMHLICLNVKWRLIWPTSPKISYFFPLFFGDCLYFLLLYIYIYFQAYLDNVKYPLNRMRVQWINFWQKFKTCNLLSLVIMRHVNWILTQRHHFENVRCLHVYVYNRSKFMYWYVGSRRQT